MNISNLRVAGVVLVEGGIVIDFGLCIAEAGVVLIPTMVSSKKQTKLVRTNHNKGRRLELEGRLKNTVKRVHKTQGVNLVSGNNSRVGIFESTPNFPTPLGLGPHQFASLHARSPQFLLSFLIP